MTLPEKTVADAITQSISAVFLTVLTTCLAGLPCVGCYQSVIIEPGNDTDPFSDNESRGPGSRAGRAGTPRAPGSRTPPIEPGDEEDFPFDTEAYEDEGYPPDKEPLDTGFDTGYFDTSPLDVDVLDTEVPLLETRCDGADDDGNGIIDDVDNNRDSICDCLKLATFGSVGGFGTNDLFETWLNDRSQLVVDRFYDDALESVLTLEYNILIIQDLTLLDQSGAAADTLASWVRSGGGVMTLNGYDADPIEIENVNVLLAPFGLAYGPEDIMGEHSGESTPVTNWTDHPITEGVTQVGMKFGRPVLGAGTVIATGQGPLDADTHNLGIVVEHGKGKVFAWADEWITYESEWIDRDDYQVERFWVNTLKWLTGKGLCQVPVEKDQN
jgi:hypothetical protein